MKLKYRIVKTINKEYLPEYFQGIWIFGSWKPSGRRFGRMEDAEKYIIEYANMVLSSHGKVVREITVK